MSNRFWIAIGVALATAFAAGAFAQSISQQNSKKKTTTKAQAKVQAKTQEKKPAATSGRLNALVPSSKPASFLSAPTIRKPATLDPNSAVEVRGQARTLSMMLVLKNGKDSINFIKVRKDYRPEITSTDY